MIVLNNTDKQPARLATRHRSLVTHGTSQQQHRIFSAKPMISKWSFWPRPRKSWPWPWHWSESIGLGLA